MKLQDLLRLAFGLLVAISLCLFPFVASAQPRRSPRINDATDIVIDLQFSPDNRTLAIARGSRDEQRVELWDVPEGTLRQAIKGFDGPIWSLSFSPDGHTLVTASGGIHPEKVAEKPTRHSGKSFTELKWWDVRTGDFKQRREFSDEDLVSIGAAYSPDGRVLATLENRVPIMLASVDMPGTAADARADIRPNIYSVHRAAMSESRVELIDAGTGDLTLKLKNKFVGAQVPLFSRGGNPRSTLSPARQVRAPLFSPDGKLVTAWHLSEVKVWSSDTGAEVLKLKDLKGSVTSVAFSPDSSLMAAAIVITYFKDHYPVDVKSEIRIWEVATGKPQPVLTISTHVVSSLIFAGNGQQLLIGGLVRENDHEYATMELADLKTGSLGKLVARDESNASSIRVSADGQFMAFQTDASTVRILSTRDWRTLSTLGEATESGSESALVRRFLVSVKSVEAVAFLGDGKTVAGEIEGGGIKVWDTRTGELKKTVGREAETGSIAAIAAGGNAVAEITGDEQVRLWSLETGDPHIVLPAKSRASAVALSGDGTILAAAAGQSISLTDVRDLTKQRRIAEVGNVTALGLSADGKLLAAATSEGVVAIWDTQREQIRWKITAPGPVTVLQFGAQDRRLAVGSKDGTVAVWNSESGQMAFESRKHTGSLNAITFSKDGTLMATGSDDRKAIIWEVAGGKARRTLSGHDLAVTSIAFSPDASLLAVGTGNASVVLWQVEKGKLDRILK
jgi:WD40 repeat protein